jgi:hypothetical protein
MAKRKSITKRPKPAAKSARPVKATKRRAAPSARSTKSPKRKSAKRTAKSALARPTNLRQTVDGYVSTLNDWRRECVASLGKIIRTAAPKASQKVRWLADPRKLLKRTGRKMRDINLNRLKEAGKHELQELMRLASRLNELKRGPTRRSKKTAKRT